MYISKVAILAAVAAVASAISVSTPPGRSCGFKIAPCPKDQKCAPNDEGCSDIGTCPGHCVFTNEYPDCGGHRPNPPSCPAGTACVDDVRIPGCGMACDRPGICVSESQPRCDFTNGYYCPRGLYCYFGQGIGIWRGTCL
jgi:hypothetical protein